MNEIGSKNKIKNQPNQPTQQAMNKIINANINGFVFPIDEVAYEQLKMYLDQLRKGIQDVEVHQDIENRIAELFNYKLKTGKQAILESDVNDIILQVGSVDELVDAEMEVDSKPSGSQTQDETYTSSGSVTERRLFRDDDNKWILGVCSGIAAYLQWDSKWVRLGFLVLLPVTAGTIVFIYLFLGVAIQPAMTPTEKLQMKGAPITFENLGKVIEHAAKTAMDKGKPVVEDISKRGIPVIIRLVAAFGLLILLIISVPALYSIIISAGVISWLWELAANTLFWSDTQASLVLLASIMVALITLGSIFYSLIRVLVNGRRLPLVVRITFTGLWLFGVGYLVYQSVSIGKEFSIKETISQRIEVDSAYNPKIKLLTISANPSAFHTDIYGIAGDGDESENFWVEGEKVSLKAIEKKKSSHVDFKLFRTVDSVPYVIVDRSSRGNSTWRLQNAKNIKYECKWTGNKLILSDFLDFSAAPGKWRAQHVLVKIYLPVGFHVQLDESCDGVIFLEYEDDTYYNFPVGSGGYKRIKVGANGNEIVD